MVVERRVVWYRRPNGPLDVRIHIGRLRLVKTVGARLLLEYHVFCVRPEEGRLVLTPAPNQDNPYGNECFRANVYILSRGDVVMRLPATLLRALGLDEKKLSWARVTVLDDHIIIEPIHKTSQHALTHTTVNETHK